MATTIVIPGADFSAHKLDMVAFGTVPCTGLSLNEQTKSVSSYSPFTLTAIPVPANTTDSIEWDTSDDTVATVADGVVSPVKMGTVIITATCGTQTASCVVTVDNIVPDYVVSGGFDAYRSSTSCINENKTTSSNNGKYGIIAGDNDDTNVRTIARNGGSTAELNSDFRFVPILIPAGAKRIKVESFLLKNSNRVPFKTRFLWFDSTQAAGSSYVGAKCLDGIGAAESWDQENADVSVIVDIPDNLVGLDSFACSLYMSEYSVAYNNNYAEYIAVSFLLDE